LAPIHFGTLGLQVVGIDNDMRQAFFGPEASTTWNRTRVQNLVGRNYVHADLDIRDREAVLAFFAHYGRGIELVIHAAAQPSHDWAAREPFTDFDINAVGTLNLLEATRLHAGDAAYIFTSTNKVYGDRPNTLPLEELETRWEIDRSHTYWAGIREDMFIDHSLHSLFGASKVAADVFGAGVRPILRNADGLLSRRHAHRAEPLGRGAARIPCLRHALRHDGDALHRVRLPGKAGQRRDSQPRSHTSL
jgi:nucleoside-diphosphate-sugar epimerase